MLDTQHYERHTGYLTWGLVKKKKKKYLKTYLDIRWLPSRVSTIQMEKQKASPPTYEHLGADRQAKRLQYTFHLSVPARAVTVNAILPLPCRPWPTEAINHLSMTGVINQTNTQVYTLFNKIDWFFQIVVAICNFLFFFSGPPPPLTHPSIHSFIIA